MPRHPEETAANHDNGNGRIQLQRDSKARRETRPTKATRHEQEGRNGPHHDHEHVIVAPLESEEHGELEEE